MSVHVPLALAAAVLMLVAACGDDSSSDDTAPSAADTTSLTDTTSSTAPSQTASEGGDCVFLTDDAVTLALGTDMHATASGPQTCFFHTVAANGAQSVTVSLTPIQIDVPTYADGTRETCEGPITDVDAGDIAFACFTFAAQGFVFLGTDNVVVEVDGIDDQDAAVADAAALLPSVTVVGPDSGSGH